MQSTRIHDYTVWYENAEEFAELKREIFTDHRYYIDLDVERPHIVDMGAHIGLSVLYFARAYPGAQIDAYEPDPANFALLKRNVEENQLIGVTLYNQAIAPRAGILTLYGPHETGWRSGVGIIPHGWRGVLESVPLSVPAVALETVLTACPDVVKMDVEGMEYELIAHGDWRDTLTILLEVHPRAGKRRQDILRKLAQDGFVIREEMDTSRYGDGLVFVTAERRRN
jgi:FkbM family methyltransferase